MEKIKALFIAIFFILIKKVSFQEKINCLNLSINKAGAHSKKESM